MLRSLAAYYAKEPGQLFLVRLAQGLVHAGKGLLTLCPYHTDRQLLSGEQSRRIQSIWPHGGHDMPSTAPNNNCCQVKHSVVVWRGSVWWGGVGMHCCVCVGALLACVSACILYTPSYSTCCVAAGMCLAGQVCTHCFTMLLRLMMSKTHHELECSACGWCCWCC
jgi:hypothetical protein